MIPRGSVTLRLDGREVTVTGGPFDSMPPGARGLCLEPRSARAAEAEWRLDVPDFGVPDAAVLKALAEFKGVGRRFQRYGEAVLPGGGHLTVVDDYGHHPVEMAATIAAARGAFPGRRLMLAFQPHRYTRTRDCFEDFVKVIGQADAVLLGEVYAAGEAPIVAADGRSLARALRVAGKLEPVFVDDIAAMPQAVLDNARDGDVVLCMGAGSIGAVAGRIMELAK